MNLPRYNEPIQLCVLTVSTKYVRARKSYGRAQTVPRIRPFELAKTKLRPSRRFARQTTIRLTKQSSLLEPAALGVSAGPLVLLSEQILSSLSY